mmetsp:Transcript_3101/g.7478  ORF Transcript_3101/g.7478 Transcript_3101/m.7478 type:complete len:909 (-) Transcript_3101:133-2859(-)
MPRAGRHDRRRSCWARLSFAFAIQAVAQPRSRLAAQQHHNYVVHVNARAAVDGPRDLRLALGHDKGSYQCGYHGNVTGGDLKQQRTKAARYLAVARMSALKGVCVETGSESQEPCTVCIGEAVTCLSRAPDGAGVHQHSPFSDDVVDDAVVQVFDASQSESSTKLRCVCRTPESVFFTDTRDEAECNVGDSVSYFHPGDPPRTAVLTDVTPDIFELAFYEERDEVRTTASRTAGHVKKDGLPCQQADSRSVRQPVSLVDANIRGGNVNSVEVEAVSCCSRKQLEADPISPRVREISAEPTQVTAALRLLEPLTGHCTNVTRGWWTYEYCHPFRLRRYHVAPGGRIVGSAVELSTQSSPTSAVLLPQDPSQTRKRPQMLEVSAQGAICERVVMDYHVTVTGTGYHAEFAAVGGTFNPPLVPGFEGRLAYDADNPHGCKPFRTKVAGSVVLVQRGGCWFQNKTVNVQNAQGAGVIIFNDDKEMLESMDGVDNVPVPWIVSILTERHNGQELKQKLLRGNSLTVKAAKTLAKEDLDINQPVQTNISFYCPADWYLREKGCQPGDDVEAIWPGDARRYKATIAQTFDNGTVEVTWKDRDERLRHVPLHHVYLKGLSSCAAVLGTSIDVVHEPYHCDSTIVIGTRLLCGHPLFLPPRPRAHDEIKCAPEGDAVAVLEERAKHEKIQDGCRAFRVRTADTVGAGTTGPVFADGKPISHCSFALGSWCSWTACDDLSESPVLSVDTVDAWTLDVIEVNGHAMDFGEGRTTFTLAGCSYSESGCRILQLQVPQVAARSDCSTVSVHTAERADAGTKAVVQLNGQPLECSLERGTWCETQLCHLEETIVLEMDSTDAWRFDHVVVKDGDIASELLGPLLKNFQRDYWKLEGCSVGHGCQGVVLQGPDPGQETLPEMQ